MVAATLPVAATFLSLEKGELEGLPRGDVSKDLGGADDLAGVVTNGRDAEGDIEAPAILAETNGFEVIDALAGANPGEDDGLVGLQLVRDDGEDGGADHLLTGVSKDAGGGGIPTGDPAGEVLADDGVVGGFDDSGEFTQALGGVFVRDSARSRWPIFCVSCSRRRAFSMATAACPAMAATRVSDSGPKTSVCSCP